MPEERKSQLVSNQRFSIPSSKAAPKPEPTPKYREPIKNYADNEETCKKALQWVSTNYQAVKEQQKRKRSDDIRQIADSMWRVDKTRSELNAEESENVEDTRADYPSTSYFETIKTISAGETSVILGNMEELPMEYEPLPGARGYRESEGLAIADDQNTVLAWAMEQKDSNGRDMYDQIRRALFFLNKYGNQVLEMDWDYRVEERTDIEPIFEKEDDDNPEAPRRVKGRKFVKRKVTVANNPRLNVHDMAQCYFDTEIEDVQDQNFFDIKKDMQLQDVYTLQRSGLLKNVDQISAKEFNGEKRREQQEREDHRGGSGKKQPHTNLVEIHRARIRIPVDDETGKWDEEGQIPHWYETWWAGDIEAGEAVCLGIIPNPHHNKKIPVIIAHAFDDDNGALHLGNPELLKSGYSMLTTIMNQYFDNVSSRNQLPFIVERGSIGKRFLTVTAGGNRIIYKEPGFADPVPLDIKDTTGQTFVALDKAEDLVRRSAGINKPLLGEGLGSRASASEAINTLNQALKPALEDAKYKAEQILPFIAEWVMGLTRQYSDPDQQIAVKFKGIERRAHPGRLWGEMNTRVVAIKKLQDSILRVQQEDTMMNQFVPVFGDLMSESGRVNLASQIARNRDFDEVDTWWLKPSDYDARHVAISESEAILLDGVTDFPKPEENHEAHIKEHERAEMMYVYTTPAGMRDNDNLARHKEHIRIHKTMQAEQQQAPEATAQPGQLEGGDAIGAPRTTGELSGDIISGGATPTGNVQTAATGRPPEAV